MSGRTDITEIKLCDGASCGHDHSHDDLGNIADVRLTPGVRGQSMNVATGEQRLAAG